MITLRDATPMVEARCRLHDRPLVHELDRPLPPEQQFRRGDRALVDLPYNRTVVAVLDGPWLVNGQAAYEVYPDDDTHIRINYECYCRRDRTAMKNRVWFVASVLALKQMPSTIFRHKFLSEEEL